MPWQQPSHQPSHNKQRREPAERQQARLKMMVSSCPIESIDRVYIECLLLAVHNSSVVRMRTRIQALTGMTTAQRRRRYPQKKNLDRGGRGQSHQSPPQLPHRHERTPPLPPETQDTIHHIKPMCKFKWVYSAVINIKEIASTLHQIKYYSHIILLLLCILLIIITSISRFRKGSNYSAKKSNSESRLALIH